jgi:hypothetical protein
MEVELFSGTISKFYQDTLYHITKFYQDTLYHITKFYQDTLYHITKFSTVHRSYLINVESLSDYKLFTAGPFCAGVGQTF